MRKEILRQFLARLLGRIREIGFYALVGKVISWLVGCVAMAAFVATFWRGFVVLSADIGFVGISKIVFFLLNAIGWFIMARYREWPPK